MDSMEVGHPDPFVRAGALRCRRSRCSTEPPTGTVRSGPLISGEPAPDDPSHRPPPPTSAATPGHLPPASPTPARDASGTGSPEGPRLLYNASDPSSTPQGDKDAY